MYVIEDIFRILVIASVDAINHVMLVSIWIKNCKCRKKLVDKLVEECNEILEETTLVKINSTKCNHNSCISYIVLFSIFFTINIGIATYFVYYKCMNHNKENVSKYDYVYQSKNY